MATRMYSNNGYTVSENDVRVAKLDMLRHLVEMVSSSEFVRTLDLTFKNSLSNDGTTQSQCDTYSYVIDLLAADVGHKTVLDMVNLGLVRDASLALYIRSAMDSKYGSIEEFAEGEENE